MNVYLFSTIDYYIGYAIVIAETTQQAKDFLEDYMSSINYEYTKWELDRILYELSSVDNKECVVFYDLLLS